MSDTINIGGITVSKFYLGGASDVKIYLGTTKLYPHLQEPCFAVVDNISTYTARTYVDVYETSSDKWYKLNNLSAYEEYGVYGSSTATTYYDGKLVIQDGYEYQYSGSSWVNIGEVSGSSITIKSPEYIQRDSSHTGYCALLEYMTQDTKIIMKHRQTNGGGYAIIGDYYKTDSDDWRVFFASSMLYYDFISQRKSVGKTIPMSVAEDWEIGNYYIKNITTSSTIITGNTQSFSTRPNQMYLYYLANAGSGSDYGEIYYIKIYRNDVLIRDFIPWTDMNGNYGLYDKVENQLVQTTGQMTASTVINDVEVGGGVEYPLYYPVKQDPPSSVTFSSMTEAEAYECPWVGMHATIAGSAYTFTSGYTWEVITLPYTELQWIEMPQTSPYCAVQLADTYSNSTSLYYDFEILFNSLADTRIIGFASYSYLIGGNGSTIFMDTNSSRAFTVNSQFTTNTKYHFGLGKRNSSSNNTFDNLDASTTYATFSTSLPTTNKPYFGAINQGSTLYVNGESERIYSIKVYDNEVLVGNYIPVKRNSDNFVTLYDTVSEQFCDTVGGGTMVAGPTV